MWMYEEQERMGLMDRVNIWISRIKSIRRMRFMISK